MNIQEIASASALIKQELTPVFEKIGQGAEWGYGIFIKQAYVNAYSDLLWMIPGLIGVIAYIWLLKNFKKISEDWYSSDKGAILFFFTLLFAVSLLLILLPISGLIQVMINPDYAAIELILKTVQQK